MMKRILTSLFYVGAVAILAGAISRLFLPEYYSYIYMSGAALFAVTRFLLRPHYDSLVLRRLVMQQQMAGILFLAAGVLMFTHSRNEWIVILLCGAVIELYTSFRISSELEKKDKE